MILMKDSGRFKYGRYRHKRGNFGCERVNDLFVTPRNVPLTAVTGQWTVKDGQI